MTFRPRRPRAPGILRPLFTNLIGFLGLGLRVSGLGFRISGFGFRVQGLGFRVWFRVSDDGLGQARGIWLRELGNPNSSAVEVVALIFGRLQVSCRELNGV